MDTDKLSSLLNTYAENYAEQNELSEKLFESSAKEEWQELYRSRADNLSRFYGENERVLKEINSMLQEPLTEETAAAVFGGMAILFSKNCFEISAAAAILNKLIPFYEEKRDTDRLIRVYEAAVMVLTLSSSQEGYFPLTAMQYQEKILSMRNEYGNIKDRRGRIVFYEVYCDLAGSASEMRAFGVEEGYRYFRDMTDLWKSDTAQALDGNDAFCRSYVDTTAAVWVNNMIFHLEGASDEIKECFISCAEKLFDLERERKSEIYQYDFNIYSGYLQAKILRNEMPPDEAARRVFSYYKERIAHLDDETSEIETVNIGELTFEQTVFLLSVPECLIRWAKMCGRETLPDEMLETITEVTRNIMYRKLSFTSQHEWEISDELARYCFLIVPYLRSREEKEQWLFNLIVRRQLPTYIHCIMVKKLAQLIFEEMFRDKPELFSDVCEVIDKDMLPDFIGKCAIFHDVGKNRIAGIINIQTRAIKDCEFERIRSHPDLGYRFICGDPDFARYKDVILGHHKFYDGKGGYPADFDNTKSPYRSVIDLITICDCMDAATDVLGRNYKRAKTADEVLAEFERDKGSRYNPYMADYINGSESLKEKIRSLVSEERIEIAYEVYKEAVCAN